MQLMKKEDLATNITMPAVIPDYSSGDDLVKISLTVVVNLQPKFTLFY
jgi:hypothetical protein